MTPVLPPEPVSRIDLARYSTGELPPEQAARVASFVDADAEARAWLADLDAARRDVAPFDADALRRRARATGTPSRPWIAGLFWLAAGAAITIGVARTDSRLPTTTPTPSQATPDVRARGTSLSLFQADHGRLVPWDGRPLGEGDVIGWTVTAPHAAGVVLVSVDGAGAVTVFHGASGEPEPISGSGPISLPGTIVLDGAPGPEVFVAVFDVPTDPVVRGLSAAFREAGVTGVTRWAERVGAPSVVVARR